MKIDQCVIFDLWGDYAHFRKIYTTTSPLSYSLPTRTALSGLIAAILGLKRDSYYNEFNLENSRFALRLIKPIKKVRFNLNIIKTDVGFWLRDISGSPRSPTPYEFIKDPHYRIFCWLKNKNLFTQLLNNLKEHKSVYTPYFGISELIAEFFFIGKFNIIEKIAEHPQEIHSILEKEKGNLLIEEGKRYASESIPMEMNDERVVNKYTFFIYETTGNPITIEKGTYYKIGEENVIFF